eukprot:scaffold229645_cov26-Tisochrysis_lutea.AAC.2
MFPTSLWLPYIAAAGKSTKRWALRADSSSLLGARRARESAVHDSALKSSGGRRTRFDRGGAPPAPNAPHATLGVSIWAGKNSFASGP